MRRHAALCGQSFVVVMLAFLFFVALLLVVAWFGLPWLVRRAKERKLAEACAARRAVVLSYDDGPSEEVTPRLLDLLERYDAPATFFLIGSKAEAHPGLVQRLVAGGHEVGSHSQRHLHAWKAAPWRVCRDIAAGVATLRRAGVAAPLFRPPFGKLTLAQLVQCALGGLRLGFWTQDSGDSWRRRPAAEVVAAVKSQQGGVVLMHDFAVPHRGDGRDGHTDYVLDLTERLIRLARDEGFPLLRLGEVLRSADARSGGRS